MRVALWWPGDVAAMVALLRLADAKHDVVLVRPAQCVAPDFLLQEQAAMLGLRLWGAPDAKSDEEVVDLAVEAVAPDAFAFAGADARGGARVDAVFPLGNVSPEEVAREAVALGVRAFVVACHSPLDVALLGRFLDDDLVADAAARGADLLVAADTFVVDAPGFARRVEATAGEARATGAGAWRLELGLRGC